MEPDKCTAAQGMDSEEDRTLPDSSANEGEKSDLDQQSLVRERNIYWFTTTLALDYLQPAFVSSIKDEMKRLQEQTLMDFGRQLCAEATSSDIIKASNNMANFMHVCPTEVVACQSLLNVLKGHTTHSVRFFDMLKDTDPQKWLNSPFEFVRLFLEDWLRCNIQDIQECDVTALCNIAMRCKPLMQLHDSTKLDAVRNVRNWAMHRPRIQTSKEEMEDNIDVILDFLQHINSFKNSDEVTQAIESIRKIRRDGVRTVVGIFLPVCLGWLQSAKRDYEHKRDEANDLYQNIVYIYNELRLLDSGHVAVTKMNEGEEQNEQATIEKLADEHKKLKQKNVDIVKLQEEKQELEKQNEELRKLLEHKRRLETKWTEELRKHLVRELECEIQREINIIRDLRADQRMIEEWSEKLCRESRIRIMTRAFLIGVMILTGIYFGIAVALAPLILLWIDLTGGRIKHGFPFLRLSGNYWSHLNFSTEKGCRDGVYRLEKIIQESYIYIRELQREKHTLKEKFHQLAIGNK